MRNFSWKCEKNARWRHENLIKSWDFSSFHEKILVISWDFPHNIIILRFCNIVEGQANSVKNKTFFTIILHVCIAWQQIFSLVYILYLDAKSSLVWLYVGFVSVRAVRAIVVNSEVSSNTITCQPLNELYKSLQSITF